MTWPITSVPELIAIGVISYAAFSISVTRIVLRALAKGKAADEAMDLAQFDDLDDDELLRAKEFECNVIASCYFAQHGADRTPIATWGESA